MKYFTIFLLSLIIAFSAHAYVFKPEVIDGKKYISANELCGAFGYSFKGQYSPDRMVLAGKNGDIIFSVHSLRILVRDKTYTLAYPVKMKGGIAFLPAGFVESVFAPNLCPVSPDPASGKKPKLGLIVLDPGHGGHDPGAIGPNGVMEKEINLDIANKLKDLINENMAVQVVMTRTQDTFVSLQERTVLANARGSGLFVSIHCNAAFSRSMQGCETFFVSEASDPEARAVEVLENSVVNLEVKELGVSKDSYLSSILEDMIYHEFVRQSNTIACSIQGKLVENLKLTDRGVKTARFYVLRGVAAPSVLVEVAFLSYPPEEAKLATESFRKKAALAIYEGIKEYYSTAGK